MLIESHLVKHWSSTQTAIAFSSRKAEPTGIVKGAASGLGCQALANGLGFDLNIEVKSDVTAAIGICRRRGLGRVRHIAVSDLWIQERVRGGDLRLSKVLGHENLADLLTKHVEKATLDRLLPLASSIGKMAGLTLLPN